MPVGRRPTTRGSDLSFRPSQDDGRALPHEVEENPQAQSEPGGALEAVGDRHRNDFQSGLLEHAARPEHVIVAGEQHHGARLGLEQSRHALGALPGGAGLAFDANDRLRHARATRKVFIDSAVATSVGLPPEIQICAGWRVR